MSKSGVGLDFVLEIDVAEDEIIQRMSGRWVHPGSGRVYHVRFNPPKVAGQGRRYGRAPDSARRRQGGDGEEASRGLPQADAAAGGLLFELGRAGRHTRAEVSENLGRRSVAEIRDRVLAALK